ncbi:type IV pilus modification protein PilV [Marinobacter sp. R17]|uniref:type IV pilus modification protein PilV n=1 Tax=Marinobacter sp. R17 TaxID=2484250 RepID=UPI000F4CE5BD|nr:type IV pilus modification protein PilV [Marinobacter sp. R17]ROU00647.1 type IV pilus modification protein PilV [Marinobacter sp. R17]
MFISKARFGKQRGFTMIEVLVALIILAIGLLGVAGVQGLSLKQTTNTATRSMVTMHAYQLSEMMRAESGSFASFAKNKSADCSGCSTVLTNWHDDVVRDVPTAQTEVSVTTNPNETEADITIYWTERDLGNDAVAQSYTLRTRLR